MLRYLSAAAVATLVALLVAWVSFVSLQRECSLESLGSKINGQTQPNGSDKNAEGSDAGEQTSKPDVNNPRKPTGTFQFQITEPNKIDGSYYAQTGDGEKSDWVNKFICETKIGELTLAILTFALVIFTGLLWASTDILGRITRESHQVNIATQRAYVSVDGIQTTFLVKQGGDKEDEFLGVRFSIFWSNSGTTPANAMQSVIAGRIVSELSEFSFSHEGVGQAINMPAKGRVASGTIDINANQATAVHNGSSHYIVFGHARYRDSFPSTPVHVSEFCYRVTLEGDLPPGKCDAIAMPYGEHNRDYDET